MPAQLFDSRELPYRAGGIRQRVVQKLEKSSEHSDPIYQRVIWEKSLEDVAEGYAVGPFYEKDEVECVLGTPSWIAMPRFPVLQADKVRPVDDGSGTGSCANSFSYITEKLQVPTADRDKLVTARGQFIEPRIVIRWGGREGPGDNTHDE